MYVYMYIGVRTLYMYFSPQKFIIFVFLLPQLIETKNTECLSTLIACGGNPNLTDKFGQSPLHLVAKVGDVEASITLLEGDATVDAVDMVSIDTADACSMYHA